jgi:N-acetylmuramoyl-L-alanine amidase
MEELIAICVGHSRRVKGRLDGGAVSIGGESEWSYNRQLAEMISDVLGNSLYNTVCISRYEGASYSSSQRWLAKRLKDCNATLAIELHFNSSDDPTANGHEWLHWGFSKKGAELAHCLDREMCLAVGEIRSRGRKRRFASDRGGQFLHGTHCPAVICEVGFGSNQKDWDVMVKKKPEIARAIAHGIMEYLD